jgi:hypothetical protein
MKNNFYLSRVVFAMVLMLSVTWTALAQDRKITGSVQDAKGGGTPLVEERWYVFVDLDLQTTTHHYM